MIRTKFVTLGIAALQILTIAPARAGEAADKQAVIATVEAALHDFSIGNMPGFKARWASQDIEIIDDVAPYVWTGHDSLARWLTDTSAVIGSEKLTHMQLVAETPRRVDIAGNHAYLVLPVVVSYEKGGVAMRQTGIQTIILDREETKWVMRVMAYAGDVTSAVKPADR